MPPAGTVRVGPRGPTTAKIMCVGEAPGANEERLGKPFVGAAGQLLEEMLAAAGCDPSDVFFTNLCKYRPPNNELRAFFDKSGMPNDRVVEGLTELKAEIEQVSPNVIVPLGNYPLRFLTGKGRWNDGYTGITDYRGSILTGSPFVGGRKCVPTFHPASILRQYSNKPIVKLDLRRAVEESASPEIRLPRKSAVIDPRGTDRLAWKAWLLGPSGAQSPPVNFGSDEDPDWRTLPAGAFLSGDIEYIGSELLCLGATRHADVAVVFAVRSGDDLRDVRDLLTSGLPLCFQNGMFDCSILEWHFGIRCFPYLRHDTLIAMHCAYTEFPKDLGFIASIFTKQPVWFDRIDWKKARSEGWTYIEREVLPYNAVDVRVTHEAMEGFLADELTQPDVRATYEFEISLIDPLWQISRRGCLIDTQRLATLRAQLEEEAKTMIGGLTVLNGGKPVNPKSPPQCAAFIYDTLGVPKVGPKTPGGAWKMNDDTLADLSLRASSDRQRTGIKLIREARERLDLISKFCEIELDDDGRMRCHYDPAKTQTGRLASRKFYPTGRGSNLQNVPRDDRVRAVFIPDPGCVLGYADLKSAESLVVAHITGDPEMLRLHSDDFMSGGADGHKYVAAYLFNKKMEDITKDERYLGKRTRHAGNYALGWMRFMQLVNADAQKTGVTVTAAEAKVFIAKYRQLHPLLEAWWRDVQAELWRTRTIKTVPVEHQLTQIEKEVLWIAQPVEGWDEADTIWLQRPHTFYDRPDSILPEAIAQSPQGTVANTLNEGLLRASRDPRLAELGYQPILQVHDAIGFQMPRSNIAPVCNFLSECMTVPLLIQRKGVEPYEITIPVDIKLGYNWGEFDPKKPDKNPKGLRDWREFIEEGL